MTLDTGRQYRYSGDLPNAKRDSVTPTWWRRPAIFMPRAASRTQLEVVSNRIERVQQISEADAVAEGTESLRGEGEYWKEYRRSTTDVDELVCASARDSFASLWDSLNAERGLSWDTNPWVWVVEFRRMEG
ncbi:hypothetical protein [Burkholderia glumae]|nr:hypothetical protein [Burkholderia glumae]